VKKGKSEFYLKNDQEKREHLISVAVGDKSLKVPKLKKEYKGENLVRLVRSLVEFDHYAEMLEKKGWPRVVLNELLRAGVAKPDYFDDRNKKAIKALSEEIGGTTGIETEMKRDEEHGVWLIEITDRIGTFEQKRQIDQEFLASPFYRRLAAAYAKISEMDRPPFEVAEDGKAWNFDSKHKLIEFVLKEGEKGATITRFKGLGEMDAVELWDTTMNPEKRTLLQVRVEDVAEADSMFSILMGDAVDPQRRFIEENALQVENLDI